MYEGRVAVGVIGLENGEEVGYVKKPLEECLCDSSECTRDSEASEFPARSE